MRKIDFKNTLLGKWSTTGWELLLLAVFSITLASCDKEILSGSGNIVTESRAVVPFTDVVADGSLHVHLRQDTDGPVEVTAEDNIMRVIDTYVSGNTLHVRIKSGVKLRSVRDIDIYVHSAHYNSLHFSGSGSVESLDTIRTDRFEYKIDGSGNTRLRVVTARLETEINGSGNIQLFGEAASFNSIINGSGDVSGLDLYCQDANILVKGSGGHTINVSRSLDVSIRGSGDVKYKGSASVSSDIQGSGRVIKL